MRRVHFKEVLRTYPQVVRDLFSLITKLSKGTRRLYCRSHVTALESCLPYALVFT